MTFNHLTTTTLLGATISCLGGYRVGPALAHFGM